MFSSVDFPVSPRKFPFFYGWVVVAVGTLGTLSSAPGQTMGVGPFTESLMADLGLTRMQLSIAYTIGTICSGFLLTRGGAFIDRLGVRRMIVFASLMFALTLVFIGSSGVIAAALASAFGESSHVAFAMGVVFLCFFFLRFWGQGIIAMTPRVMIGKWFQRRRGLAIGITGVFVSFGFGTSPVVFNKLIGILGWRETYYLMAATIGIGLGLVGWIFYREQPEDCGLLKDGRDYTGGGEEKHNPEFVAHRDFTLDEVWRSYPFWVFTAGLGSQGLVVTGATFHIVSISETAGITGDQGLALFLPMSVFIVLTNLTAGWLSDKTKLKYLLIFMMGMQVVGTVGLMNLGNFAGRIVFVAGFGMSGGMFGTLIGATWPRFYGLTHLGAISGLNMSMMVLATSVGPILFAGSFRVTESYANSLLICAALPVMVLVAAIRANNPQLKS